MSDQILLDALQKCLEYLLGHTENYDLIDRVKSAISHAQTPTAQGEIDPLSKPDQLCPKGDHAWQLIVTFLQEKGLTCKQPLFHSPADWAESCNLQGADNLLLIITPDSGVAAAFDWHTGAYALMEKLRMRLVPHCLVIEQMPEGCCAVYYVERY